MMIKNLMKLCAFVFLAPSVAFSSVVEWEFPREGGCHEGLAFADGVTGVLVWGGGDTVKLTVGRGDLWDHRGGYSWMESQSYSNIVSLVQSGAKDELYALFKKETPKDEPRNPCMLPLGRVVVKLPGGKLTAGTLDTKNGLGVLEFTMNGETKRVEIAMSKASRAFAMRFPDGVDFKVDVIPSIEMPKVKEVLVPRKFKPVEWFPGQNSSFGGFVWALPADRSVSLAWKRNGSDLFLGTSRGGEKIVLPDAFDTVREGSVAHWSRFWAEGAKVSVPDPVIQRMFDYGMYRFGAMTDPDGMPAGLQGAWLEDDKLVPWNGDYHFNINVQECYSPAYRGGHFSHLMPLFRMVLSWRDILKDNARKFAGVDGYVLPHSVDDRGVCIGGFWTGTIDHASTAWVASMMYRYVRYSGDVEFLRSGAYDFMKGAMRVYRAMMEERDGKLSIPVGPSPEWGDKDVQKAVGRDPSFQLAAAHRLARDLIDAAKRLGEEPDSMWLDVEKRLPLYTADSSGIMLFKGQRFVESHRHHSHMAGLYPFDTIDFSDPKTLRMVEATYRNWTRLGMGLWSGWCVPWASILHTHIGNAPMAVFMLHAWDTFFTNPGYGSRHDVYNQGLSIMRRGTNSGRFTIAGDAPGEEIMQMDGMCASVTAIMELMVHDVNGSPNFFSGCPSSWKEVSFENIRLSDGRKASGTRKRGNVSVTFSDDRLR